jgi:hypothetical protein
MPSEDPITSSERPPVKPRMSAAQRRAAEMTVGAGKQAQLKQEAAERRAERAEREGPSPKQARTNALQRRLPR